MLAKPYSSTDWANPQYERACLLPFFIRDGVPYYGLFVAPGSLRLSVVGGSHEPDKDSDLLDTLVRESREELGDEFVRHVDLQSGFSFDLNCTLCLAAPVAPGPALRAHPNDEVLCLIWMPFNQLHSLIVARKMRVSADLTSLASMLPDIVLSTNEPPVERRPLVRPPPVHGGDSVAAAKVLSTAQGRYRVFVALNRAEGCLATADGSYFFLPQARLAAALRSLRAYSTGAYVNTPETERWARSHAASVQLLRTPPPEPYASPRDVLAQAVLDMRRQEAEQYARLPATRKNVNLSNQEAVLAIAAQNERMLFGDTAPPPPPRALANAVRMGAYTLHGGVLAFPTHT